MKTDHHKLGQPHDFESLWSEAESIWSANVDEPAFAGYVSADYKSIYRKLLNLRGRVDTFLEWGSGLGVVAIMASRMGFDAYGIEVEPELVELARGLADKHAASTTFAIGSFVPVEFEARMETGDEFHRTVSDEDSAYEQIGMQLRDFDLVYAYPWPEEQILFRNMMLRCAAPNALFLRYDNREGLSLTRPAARRKSR